MNRKEEELKIREKEIIRSNMAKYGSVLLRHITPYHSLKIIKQKKALGNPRLFG